MFLEEKKITRRDAHQTRMLVGSYKTTSLGSFIVEELAN